MWIDDTPSPDEHDRALGRLDEVRRRAKRRNRMRRSVLGAGVVIVALAIGLPVSLLPGDHRERVDVTGRRTSAPTTAPTTSTIPPTTPLPTTTTTVPVTTSTAVPTTTTTTLPSTTTTTSTTVAAATRLPITVQTDAQMQAAGNGGPSSTATLEPSSCQLVGGTVTATGTYAGGFAPEVYDRYGDVVELYVYTAPQSGYPSGIQIAALSSEHPPAMGSGTWTVSASLQPGNGAAASCQVAAQPTHDVQLAP